MKLQPFTISVLSLALAGSIIIITFPHTVPQEIMITEDLGIYRGIQEMIKPCLTEESNGVYSLTMKQSAIIAVSCKNRDSYSIQWNNDQVKYTTTLINK